MQFPYNFFLLLLSSFDSIVFRIRLFAGHTAGSNSSLNRLLLVSVDFFLVFVMSSLNNLSSGVPLREKSFLR